MSALNYFIGTDGPQGPSPGKDKALALPEFQGGSLDYL